MFKVNTESTSAEVVSAEETGIKNPKDLEKSLSIPQVKEFFKVFVGSEVVKGTTKSVACVELFKAIATKLGYNPEEVEAGVAYVYPAPVEGEKPVKERKVREKKEPGVRIPSARNMTIQTGTFPVAVEGVKLNWNAHAQIFAEAILALVAEGKTSATREDIFTKAESFTKVVDGQTVKDGIKERKASTQEFGSIFSWWRPELVACGFISAAVPVVVEAPVAPVVEAPAA